MSNLVLLGRSSPVYGVGGRLGSLQLFLCVFVVVLFGSQPIRLITCYDGEMVIHPSVLEDTVEKLKLNP